MVMFINNVIILMLLYVLKSKNMQYKQAYFDIKNYEIINQSKIDLNKVLESKLKYVELELSKVILSKDKL